MKKVLVVSAFAVLGVAALSSCVKDWTCTCVTSGGTGSETFEDTKKKDAKDACDANETVAKLFDPTASCSIK
jgi:hypothetical protein